MNTHQNSRSTSFHHRNVRSVAFRRQPARFTVEDESEGVELFLRGLLILSMIVALSICNVYLMANHNQPSVLPSHDTALATTQHAANVPAAEAL